MNSKILPLAALSLLFPLALLGCGGGGGSGPSTQPTSTPIPTSAPTANPTPGATSNPTPNPTVTASTPQPTTAPTATPTPRPTATPAPTVAPLPPLSTPIPLIEGRRMGTDYFQAPNSGGQPTDSLICEAAHFDYHVHSHLSIFLNGTQLSVPAAIGIANPHFITTTEFPDGFADYGSCVYPLHTHDTSGKLHVEAPTRRTFTLGQVFRIWGQPLVYATDGTSTRNNIAGITGLPVAIFINDGTNLRRYNGDPNSIVLTSKREITFQIGSPISQIPTYIWYGEEDQNNEHNEMTAARFRAYKAK